MTEQNIFRGKSSRLLLNFLESFFLQILGSRHARIILLVTFSRIDCRVTKVGQLLLKMSIWKQNIYLYYMQTNTLEHGSSFWSRNLPWRVHTHESHKSFLKIWNSLWEWTNFLMVLLKLFADFPAEYSKATIKIK